ncbi:RHS repeat domain-containing protein [Flavobacterium lipolyticum]|uniref:RHS repeat-associated core domain-containing protein n=1 Tax=Flavobacterium lipolyticum TaxID=2893754 RepID=A0ABS8M4M8_9FLAO|nr:RHS repeat-associated core domain-containing protein [Flavobacterium sp. F-126]MCC9019747.1 hypothetical protein [Flavobacterium sp. F-126]
MEFFPTAEGYYDYIGKKYVYQYKDHLGNIRLSYAKNPATQVLTIIDENNYYPFGLKHKGYNDYVPTSNKYKFNGKELQDELGLGMTAMDFRQYDNTLGRFNSIDVLAELFSDGSPYMFSFNNPVAFADPTGLCPQCPDPSMAKNGQKYVSTGGMTYTFNDGQWTGEGGELKEVVVTRDKREKKETSDSEGQEGKHPDAGSGVGQPGALESMIPVWGSGRAAIDHFQNGNYWQGTFYTAMAISDVFLVKSIATGIAKGGLKAFGKSYSSWSSYRRFYGKEGFAETGQHLHHWALRRNGQKVGSGLGWKLKNQMWNLMPMRSPAFHTAVHGNGINAFNTLERAYYGSPIWFQTGIISTIGHSLELRYIYTDEESETE